MNLRDHELGRTRKTRVIIINNLFFFSSGFIYNHLTGANDLGLRSALNLQNNLENECFQMKVNKSNQTSLILKTLNTKHIVFSTSTQI